MASEWDEWRLNAQDMPLSILTEVTSTYPSRGDNLQTEALIAAGKSALGQDADPTLGWGLLGPVDFVFQERWRIQPTWYVQRAEKESAVLTFDGLEPPALKVGQRVMNNPSDSAAASEKFGWYFCSGFR
jgi:D-serine deaminase-like pyridoxal phosphate-dependent protein